MPPLPLVGASLAFALPIRQVSESAVGASLALALPIRQFSESAVGASLALALPIRQFSKSAVQNPNVVVCPISLCPTTPICHNPPANGGTGITLQPNRNSPGARMESVTPLM